VAGSQGRRRGLPGPLGAAPRRPQACIHTYMHTYIHTYLHVCIHTYIHTQIEFNSVLACSILPFNNMHAESHIQLGHLSY
jgi:hypothetical protein